MVGLIYVHCLHRVEFYYLFGINVGGESKNNRKKKRKTRYLSVVREATQGGDVLDRKVSLRGGRGHVALLSDPVDLLVELFKPRTGSRWTTVRRDGEHNTVYASVGLFETKKNTAGQR